MESDKDSDNDSKESIDWGLTFAILKSKGFSMQEIYHLSYPQLNAFMTNLSNPATYNIFVPYLGSSKDKKDISNGTEINSKEELASIIAGMNQDFN